MPNCLQLLVYINTKCCRGGGKEGGGGAERRRGEGGFRVSALSDRAGELITICGR